MTTVSRAFPNRSKAASSPGPNRSHGRVGSRVRSQRWNWDSMRRATPGWSARETCRTVGRRDGVHLALESLVAFRKVSFDGRFGKFDAEHRVTARLQIAHVEALAAQRHKHRGSLRDTKGRPVVDEQWIRLRLMESNLVGRPPLQPELTIHDGSACAIYPAPQPLF